ncbi:hypothetical protein V6K52_02115 [Knoellia sp. S7-12]|uniref:hypothetical protein n=1 Tax=Knoellia sp. S7-12 TaxID=3126698 RepID=UPI003365F753
MLEFVTRSRSARSLFATMFLAWVVAVSTSQIVHDGLNPALKVAMAVAMIVGLVVALFCLVKLLLLALRG